MNGFGAEVVEGFDMGVEGGDEIAEGVLARGLSEEHGDQVRPGIEGLDVVVGV